MDSGIWWGGRTKVQDEGPVIGYLMSFYQSLCLLMTKDVHLSAVFCFWIRILPELYIRRPGSSRPEDLPQLPDWRVTQSFREQPRMSTSTRDRSSL